MSVTISANEFLAKKKQADHDNNTEPPPYTPIYDITKRTADGTPTKFSINLLKLNRLLRERGFLRLDEGKRYFTIQINENQIKERNIVQVVDDVEEYLTHYDDLLPDGIEKDDLINKIYNGLTRYFSTPLLNRLHSDKNLNIQNHTQDAGYFYYRNGYVEVTKDGPKFKQYSELEGVIWGNQILDRDFKVAKSDAYESSNFARFIKNISNCWEKRFYDQFENPNSDCARYEKFKAIIGYGLHSYFDGKLRAVILTDSRVTDDASGRSGKTLLLKAMGHMLNNDKHSTTYIELNGKDFDPTDKFKYQALSMDTRLVHINDVLRNFDIERLFNDITEGIICQRKNEQPFQVPAKLFLSTNRLVKIEGESAKDRSIEFELADYYKAGQGPDVEFGEWFFRDWNANDWNQFDNFMISCLHSYLKNGLQEVDGINLLTRKLNEHTSAEFVQFMEEILIEHQRPYDKKELYVTFIHQYSDFAKWLKQNTFTKWLKLYADYSPNIKNYETSRNNKKDYITYYYHQPEGVGESI